jgi:hypothetical protein
MFDFALLYMGLVHDLSNCRMSFYGVSSSCKNLSATGNFARYYVTLVSLIRIRAALLS